jgi:hypothetical protein
MSPKDIRLLVEGNLDEAVGRKIAKYCGLIVIAVNGRRGADYIRQRISSFNKSAAAMPIVTIADSMDMNEPCPPATKNYLLPHPHRNMRFRLAVHEIESWLLADRNNLSRFLSVPINRIPSNPDDIPDPKACLISIARRSRNRSILSLLVPSSGSSGVEGPGYTSEMQRFVNEYWNIESGVARSNSLRRCVEDIRTLNI